MNTPRARLALLGALLAVATAGFWWKAYLDPRTPYLARQAPAEWILYPTPPDPEMHLAAPVWAEFRREFVLPQAPGTASLELRAFTTSVVRLNDQPVPYEPPADVNWKRKTALPVGSLLRPGTNRLSVIVTNPAGPPALWAVLRSDGFTLTTDRTWEASLTGAIWQQATLAGQPRTRLAGDPLFGSETVRDSFGRVVWVWLVGFAVILGVMVLWKKFRSFLSPPAGGEKPVRREWLSLMVLGVVWVALLANNLPQMPSLLGFDNDGHTEYIHYVQQHGRLPLANEGWQMYQPPLYYLLATGLLEVAAREMDEKSVTLVRALSGVIGFAHVVLLWLALRRIFPGQRSLAILGICFAASLPAFLCVSHFITNEGLAALLCTATLYFGLRTTRDESPSRALWGATGLCFGLALLAKFSAIVLAPFVVVWLVWHALNSSRQPGEARSANHPPSHLRAMRVRGLLLALAACLVVCGWHYARVWVRFGNPLVGNWSPESGFAWWQENGYTTASHFASFGRALSAPLFSGFDSVAGGLYSTLWADGLCSGGTKLTFRPPWNYVPMIAGLWLALVPAALALLGAVRLVGRWLRGEAFEPLLWPAVLVAYGAAITFMILRVPSYAQAKAVYGLGALLPLCVCLLTGLETLRRLHRWLHRVCVAALVLWMLNASVSFWIRSGSAATHEMLAANLLELGHPTEVLAAADQALQLDPSSALAATQRAAALRNLGRLDDAHAQAAHAYAQHGVAGGAWLEVAALAAAGGDFPGAATLALEAATKLPDDPLALHDAAAWTLQSGQPERAEQLCRRALRVRFANPQLHFILAKSLAARSRDAEAIAHLRLATRFKPDWSVGLNDLAWMLASHPEAALRNGAEAVALAERACELTRRQQPQLLGTLAAAYAEAGRFADAVRSAEAAIELARAAGLGEIVTRNEALLQLYRAGKAYHEPVSPTPARN